MRKINYTLAQKANKALHRGLNTTGDIMDNVTLAQRVNRVLSKGLDITGDTLDVIASATRAASIRATALAAAEGEKVGIETFKKVDALVDAALGRN